jgi:hypothetical protein
MMKRWLLLLAVLALVAAACGDSDEGDAAPTTEAATAETGAPEPDITEEPAAAGSVTDLAITEVAFDGQITITNLGDGVVSVDGLWLCNRPSYLPLPTAAIAPGESLQISSGDLGLTDSGGEVALYSSDSFGDSSAILDYVAWGSGGGRGSVAADAGLWPAGETVATGGASISAPNGGAGAADWS